MNLALIPLWSFLIQAVKMAVRSNLTREWPPKCRFDSDRDDRRWSCMFCPRWSSSSLWSTDASATMAPRSWPPGSPRPTGPRPGSLGNYPFLLLSSASQKINGFARQSPISAGEEVEIISNAESGERILKLKNAKNFVGLSFNVLLQADRTAGIQTSASLTFPTSEVLFLEVCGHDGTGS